MNMENTIVMMMHTVPTLKEHSIALAIMISKIFITEMELIVMVRSISKLMDVDNIQVDSACSII